MQLKQETKKKRPKNRPGLEPAVGTPMHDTSHQSPFIRALGSTDFTTRAKGVQALTRFLQLKSELSTDDLLKIWKGLYVCFWHSDKAPVQVGGVNAKEFVQAAVSLQSLRGLAFHLNNFTSGSSYVIHARCAL